MLIYYCGAIILNVIAAIVFSKHINITELSGLPLFLIAIMLFQSWVYKNEKVENGIRTSYGSVLTESEENEMLGFGSKFIWATIPWMIPFILFFPSLFKLFSVFVYFVGFTGGFWIYRLKNKNKISSRMKLEEQERIEQEKKEHLGKWK